MLFAAVLAPHENAEHCVRGLQHVDWHSPETVGLHQDAEEFLTVLPVHTTLLSEHRGSAMQHVALPQGEEGAEGEPRLQASVRLGPFAEPEHVYRPRSNWAPHVLAGCIQGREKCNDRIEKEGGVACDAPALDSASAVCTFWDRMYALRLPRPAGVYTIICATSLSTRTPLLDAGSQVRAARSPARRLGGSVVSRPQLRNSARACVRTLRVLS